MKIIPNCDCHNHPMFWHKDARKKPGGYWACRIKKRERDSKYNSTEKGKTRLKVYRATEKGQTTLERAQKKWLSSHVRVYVAGLSWCYPIDPSKKEAYEIARSMYREQQSNNYRKESELWLAQPGSLENIRNG